MCMVSAAGDHYRKRYPQDYPWIPQPGYPWPAIPGGIPTQPMVPPMGPPPPTTPQFGFPQQVITREEFDALRKDVLEMKEILKVAAKYDKETGQPHCEMDEKVELLKRVAKFVGVDLSEVFGHEAK